MKKLLMTVLTCGGCFIAAYFLWTPESVPQIEDEEYPHNEFFPFSHELIVANEIEIEKASSGKLKQHVQAPAQITIIPDQKAHVLPKASGIVLTAYKNLGEPVVAGEVLAVFESKEMAEAKSNYLSVLKKAQLAATKFNREKILQEKNSSSTEEYTHAQTMNEEALIELDLVTQKLFTLGLTNESIKQLPHQSSDTLGIYEMRSPIDGKIIARRLTPGEFLTKDHEAYTIADLSSVWAKIYIFSQDRAFVKQGQHVTITTDDGKNSEHIVSYLSPVIDPETRTSKALVKINNQDESFLPGSFVQAEFITDEIDASLVVKKDAIQNVDGVDVLFISAMSDSVVGFEVRPIIPGRMDEHHCEIISGLNSGEDYACRNAFLLKADLKKTKTDQGQ